MQTATALWPREESRQVLEGYVTRRLTEAGRADTITLHVGTIGVGDILSDRSGLSLWPGGQADVLPVYLYDAAVLVGPMTARDRQPCVLCVARRWQQIRSYEERDALELGAPIHASPMVPHLTDFALEATWQLADAALRANDAVHVWELRLDTMTCRRGSLLADADCPQCGDRRADTPDGAAIAFRSRLKSADDAYRTRSIHDYGLVTDLYANPVCGALGARADHKIESTTTAPTIGCLPIRGNGYLHYSVWGGHSDSFDNSTLLGIFEGLERHAGVRPRRIAPSTVGSYNDLRATAVNPREIGVYADEYYRLTTRHVAYSDDLSIPWVWGTSLRDSQPRLVPQIMTYYHCDGLPNKFVQECSNGCAAGSCIEEAVLFGLLELIERDAFLLHWYGRRRPPEIDTASCRDPATRAMVNRFELIGYHIRLFDMRVSFPIPAVVAVAVRADGGPGALAFGGAASFNVEDAVRSAMYEAAAQVQSLVARTVRAADTLRAMMADYHLVRELSHHAGLFGLPEMIDRVDWLLQERTPVPLAELYRTWEEIRPRTRDLLDDVRFAMTQLVAAGFDVVAVDQTSPEQLKAGVRSAALIVPGLIPIDFGWDMQRVLHMPRMRTAFREKGWRETDLTAADLLYVPHPFP